jgi:3-oxoacyl-[acyl-carrier protein] reductase
MLFDLTGRTALDTGATGGIGAKIAEALHAQGATVALSGTRQAALDEAREKLGSRAHAIACDLSRAEEVEKLVPAAEAQMGSLDILVSNAGITRDMLALRMKDEDWAAVLDVNLTAAFRLSRAALRGMMKRRFGRIIGIASIVGVTGNAGQANYAASKAGMIGMTKALAQEVASRQITVNCVAPGFIPVERHEDVADAERAAYLATVPAGHIGTPADVAHAVAFFASEAAGFITGQRLVVDGGRGLLP